MKKAFSFLTSLIILSGWAATANATTYSWPVAFNNNPNSFAPFVSGSSGPRQWNGGIGDGSAGSGNATQEYFRNAYWNFTTDPRTTAPAYNGLSDSTLKSGDSKFTFSNANVSYQSGSIGDITNKGTSGTATFSLANTVVSGNTEYVWVETDVLLNKGGSVQLALAGATQSWVTGDTPGTAVASNTVTFAAGTNQDAWFKINPALATQAFTFTFTTANGNGSSASIQNLHIAMTPEPITLALFASGAAVLFFRRRQMGLQVA